MRQLPSRLVIFESVLRENLHPLTLTRCSFDLLLGSTSLIRRVERRLQMAVTDAIVPEYLHAISKEMHPDVNFTTHVAERSLVVNSQISPRFDLERQLRQMMKDQGPNFIAVDQEGIPIFGILDRVSADDLSTRPGRQVRHVFIGGDTQALLKYPWDLVSENGSALEQDYEFISKKNFRGYLRTGARGLELLGKKIAISESAEVGRFVTMDSRHGPIIVDDLAVIQSQSHITGPCYVGEKSVIKSARVREDTSIGRECRVGGEVEASIISDYSNKNHDGFIGHSIIGSWVNMGALTTNSDLKNTYGEIRATVKSRDIKTGSVKVGCFIADMAKTSIGSLISSGNSIGVSSQVFGLVLENVPSFAMHAKSLRAESREIYIDSAIKTQQRMMERRGLTMTQSYSDMMKYVFEITSEDRAARGVMPGKFEL